MVIEQDDYDQYFLAIEQTPMLESRNVATALFLLLATHYVFNLSYHSKSADFLIFVQERIAKIPSFTASSQKKCKENLLFHCPMWMESHAFTILWKRMWVPTMIWTNIIYCAVLTLTTCSFHNFMAAAFITSMFYITIGAFDHLFILCSFPIPVHFCKLQRLNIL